MDLGFKSRQSCKDEGKTHTYTNWFCFWIDLALKTWKLKAGVCERSVGEIKASASVYKIHFSALDWIFTKYLINAFFLQLIESEIGFWKRSHTTTWQ